MLYKCAEIHYTASVFGDKAESTGGVVIGCLYAIGFNWNAQCVFWINPIALCEVLATIKKRKTEK